MHKAFLLVIVALLISACGDRSGPVIPESQEVQYEIAVEQTMKEEGRIFTEARADPDKTAKYIFYLHGRIVEDQGLEATSPQFGKYEYEEILGTLADRGFTVISEVRAKDTNIKQYAQKIAGQVNALLKAGVPPAHITIVGASKGGTITHLVSSLIKNRDINVVLLAACGKGYHEGFAIDLVGNVLGIYDSSDDKGAGSCEDFFAKSKNINRHKDIDLKNGLGHGILYQPLEEWIGPTVHWASGDYQ